MSKQHSCAWCGSELPREKERRQSCLCPECQKTYEAEAYRSLHPVEVRQPHND